MEGDTIRFFLLAKLLLDEVIVELDQFHSVRRDIRMGISCCILHSCIRISLPFKLSNPSQDLLLLLLHDLVVGLIKLLILMDDSVFR